MKKLVLLLFCLVAFVSVTFSQDYIVRKNGDEIKAIISEVGHTEVKYKKFDLPNGPVFSILKSDLFMIRYQNGSKDVFNEVAENKPAPKSTADLISQAKSDARRSYKGKKSGAGWTNASTIVLSPLFGVIPAAICASNEPAEENLRVPDPEQMKNNEYANAYRDEAHKIKKRKVWTAFGIGTGVWLLIITLFAQ